MWIAVTAVERDPGDGSLLLGGVPLGQQDRLSVTGGGDKTCQPSGGRETKPLDEVETFEHKSGNTGRMEAGVVGRRSNAGTRCWHLGETLWRLLAGATIRWLPWHPRTRGQIAIHQQAQTKFTRAGDVMSSPVQVVSGIG